MQCVVHKTGQCSSCRYVIDKIDRKGGFASGGIVDCEAYSGAINPYIFDTVTWVIFKIGIRHGA